MGISIHALREEGDYVLFQDVAVLRAISIHALREEGDLADLVPATRRADFYPRPPRGGRQPPPVQGQSSEAFLSTPSARRATA